MKSIYNNIFICLIALFISSCSQPQNEPEEPTVQLISLKTNYVSNYVGFTFDIDFYVYPDSLKEQTKIIWTSTDPTIASVNDGHVTLLKKGNCCIYAMVADNINIKDSCTICVLEEEKIEPPTFEFELYNSDGNLLTVEEVSSSKYKISGVVGEYKPFQGYIKCRSEEDLRNFSIQWKSNLNFSQIFIYDSSAWFMQSKYEDYKNGLVYFTYNSGCRYSVIYINGKIGYYNQTGTLQITAYNKSGGITSKTLEISE